MKRRFATVEKIYMKIIYKEISLSPLTAEQSDVLVAMLFNIGFDGFEILKETLNAYIPEVDYPEVEIQEIKLQFPEVTFATKNIEEQNWNAIWEASFDPVLVNYFVAVRASFHPAQLQVKHDIIITPKMSFGTGHHATTALVIGLMEDINFKNKTVLDFGTGTGVLAILAKQLGATSIVAIDNDKWSIENAKENFELNAARDIILEKAESLAEKGAVDIIIANINLNVLLANMDDFCRILRGGGTIIFSGLLVNDEEKFKAVIFSKGFELRRVNNKDGWIAIEASFISK